MLRNVPAAAVASVAVTVPEVVTAELGVELSTVQYRIPDLVVLSARDVRFDDKSVTRLSALVIEVASPSTALYDRNRKKDVYAGFGIASYWIVRPDLGKPGLTAYELRRGQYRLVADVAGAEAFTTPRPFRCEIVPAALGAGPWQP